MAPSTPISSLTDELMTSIIPTSPSLSKFRKLRDNFTRQLRHHNYARTNQFEVLEKLDGLQEKFLILNRDDLADALHTRLRELQIAKTSSEKWLPDVLHLLLQLSGDPVGKTKVDDLAKDRTPVEVVRPLRWEEVEAEDPIDCQNKIWETPNFSDLSSDEDVSIPPSQPISPGAPHIDENGNHVLQDHSYLVERDLTIEANDLLSRKQIWRAQAEAEVTIDELQAIRETLFMLQGLPTTVFWRVGYSIEIDRRVRLAHASFHLLRDILESFAKIGLRLDQVRTWLKKPQTVPFMQSLRLGIERRVLDFDSSISEMESRLVALPHSATVSLASALEEVVENSKLVMQLATFLNQVVVSATDGVQCLDLLYDVISSCQASGAEDLLEPLINLFVQSFEVYLRPILAWINFGEIDSSLKSMSFVEITQERSLPGLWNDWYKLKDGPSSDHAPRLMKPFLRQIFVIGKTMVFLRHLPNTGQVPLSEPTALATAQIRSTQPSSLIPFSEAFQTATKSAIGDLHRSSTTQLRRKLGDECGLWRTLDALHSIFLGKLGWATDAIDATIFDRIDSGNRAWNDRYLLTELWRKTFQGVSCIDTDRITIRVGRSSSRDMQSQRRSAKMLEGVGLNYTLPWPVANIVSKGALESYKALSIFLFQIRRARYTLERSCRPTVMVGRLDHSLYEQRLARNIHCRLLIFVNYLYDHLTLFSIERTTVDMLQALTAATDVDGMIQAHQSYVSKLEEMCLVSRRVSTVKKAIMIVLDLCIRFSDTVMSPVGRKPSIDTQSFKSASSQMQGRSKAKGTGDSSSDEGSGDSEGFSTFITFDDRSYESELSDIKQQFGRQKSFIVAGLKSIARVEGQSGGWDILAERLDWQTDKKP